MRAESEPETIFFLKTQGERERAPLVFNSLTQHPLRAPRVKFEEMAQVEVEFLHVEQVGGVHERRCVISAQTAACSSSIASSSPAEAP